MFYPATILPAQTTNPDNGELASGFVLSAYLAGTTTPTNMYSDKNGTIAGASVTLNSGGYPEVSGSIITIWLDSEIEYKFILRDPEGGTEYSIDYVSNAQQNLGAIQDFDSLADFIATTPSANLVYIKSYHAGYFSGVLGPNGAHHMYATGADNANPSVGSSVSASSIGTGVQAGYRWDASGNEWKIADKTVDVSMFGAYLNDLSNDSTTAFNDAQAFAGWATAQPGIYTISGAAIGNFTTTGKVSINGGGSITSVASLQSDGELLAQVTPTGQAEKLDVGDAVLASMTMNRSRITYVNATTIAVNVPDRIPMAGFRFGGSYKKSRVPSFATNNASGVQSISLSTDLGAQTTSDLNTWYAAFAVADSGGTVSYKLMPYIRVGSVASNVVTINEGGEFDYVLAATTLDWVSDNNLAGTECLIIHETVNGRSNHFSGRVTTVTANTDATVTLDDAGGLGFLDYILVAPPGFDHYVYLGSFYLDTAEVRNIADVGNGQVKAKMVNILDPNFSATGDVPTATQIKCGGHICPLATGIIIKEALSLSTASTGDYASYFWHDSSQHQVAQNYNVKEAGLASKTFVDSGIVLPFGFDQSFYFSTAGSLATARVGGTLEVEGWIEP